MARDTMPFIGRCKELTYHVDFRLTVRPMKPKATSVDKGERGSL